MRIDNSGMDRTDNPFFIGTVVENKDPDFNYRIKVRIHKIHDKIDDENLPWAARVDSTFMGIGDEQDLKHSIPEKNTQVLVLAIKNDINSLLYLGNLYKKTPQTPTNEQYNDSYGIYRKDGQFIGIEKINKIFKMLFDGDIEVDKVHNIKINTTDNITVNCKNAKLTATNNIEAQCKNAKLIAEENINAECNKISVECKKADLKSENTVNVECQTATVKASSKTDINSPTMNMTGNVNIKGNVTITGNNSINGNLKSTGNVSFTSYASGTGHSTDTGIGVGGAITVSVKDGVVTGIS